ncbi:EamA family transporter [Bradyrhizobium sp. 83012]|uniref:EamA family transporter n=1 Tax=Bradyrhizobium aeschynomenes TaxID=2734909 RepID=A0ABX2CDK6_9BRAD|nr:EamA family transporter [Bradyrhizobium aeschynomenes]NPV20023.1 EamA family transporter [Bradyrhizobium aeschynomenes]
MRVRKTSASAALCLIFVILIWGVNWLVIKDALRVAPPLFFTGLRLLGGAVAIAAARLALGHQLRLGDHGRLNLFAVGMLQMACGLGLSLVGLQYLDIGRSALIFYTMPLWLAIIEWVFDGRRQTGFELAAIGSGLGGIMLLGANGLGLPAVPTSFNNAEGVALLLIAAICWALGTWLANRTRSDIDVWSRTIFQLATSGAAVMTASIVLEPHLDVEQLSALAVPIAFNCIVATGLAFVAWYYALASIPARIASQSLVLIPVVALMSALILQGEELALQTVLACVLIIMGVTIVIWQREEQPSRNSTVRASFSQIDEADKHQAGVSRSGL